MFGIEHLLKKMQNRQTREFFVREAIKDALKSTTNIEVSIEDIKIIGSTVTFLNLSQTAKSEIFIKKQTILSAVNSKQDIVKIMDLK